MDELLIEVPYGGESFWIAVPPHPRTSSAVRQKRARQILAMLAANYRGDLLRCAVERANAQYTKKREKDVS